MSDPVDDSGDITQLLAQWRAGDRSAEERLMNKVYPALRDIARARLHRSPDDFTLSATELANEAYARLSRIEHIDYQDRVHFLAVAARTIRHFVIDHLRSRSRDKRGGHQPFVALDSVADDAGFDVVDLRVDWLAVHAALIELETIDSDSALIVELKFFSGMTTDEIAAASGTSRATVVRNWRFAKAWLMERLGAQR